MVTSNGSERVVLLSAVAYAALMKLRVAYRGEVTAEFKQDLAQFMDQHDAVLEGLAQ